jgi:FAD dependent oxidoreductase TIGR03364
MKPVAIVVGAGIVGLAAARALSLKGYAVTIIERNHKAIGASIRNFGMVWPVGQPEGLLYESAVRSASIWKQICSEAGFYYDTSGSIHIAYEVDEENVLEEVFEYYKNDRPLELLNAEGVKRISPAAVDQGLRSGFLSRDEVIVDPREVIFGLPAYLKEKYGVDLVWNEAVVSVEPGVVVTAEKKYSADLILVCSGVEFETLFPDVFKQQNITKCKLQMMRFVAQPEGWRMGPAMCGGLSLTHYQSFKVASGLTELKERVLRTMPEYVNWGIHVMVSQNGMNELTVGDSHEYGGTHDPFDNANINQLILDYLKRFARFANEEIKETWNGVYAKHAGGEPYLFMSPGNGVYILNGLGGAGMTLSFGLSETLLKDL